MSQYRESTYSDGDSLEEFRYDRGDRFVRAPHYREDEDDPTEWSVAKRRFVYTVSYLPDRDGTPGPAEHREYELVSREFERTTVTEADLRTEWDRLEGDNCTENISNQDS